MLEESPEVWQFDPGHSASFEERQRIIHKYSITNDLFGLGTLAVTDSGTGQLMGYLVYGLSTWDTWLFRGEPFRAGAGLQGVLMRWKREALWSVDG